MADAGALDDLDLDDMFAEDGDMLFEGLDIELDGMGDIINNEKKGQATPAAPPRRSAPLPTSVASHANRRAGGPRTKKTNPMLEKVEDDDEGGSKRRKTKRKSKAPSAFGDDDEEFTDEQPKKKRKAAIRAKKATEITTSPAKTKRKRKMGETSVVATSAPVMSASVSTGASSPKVKGPPMTLPKVASAGQFGGRLKRGASTTSGSTKVKRKLKKAAARADAGEGMGSSAVPHIPAIRPPKPEPTFGGLAPSKTLFYPFLEAVPPEPSLQKRKAYPIMDRISSALANQLLSSSSTSSDKATGIEGEVTEETAIFKLMAETYEGNEKDKSMFTPEKRAALLKGIPQLREMIGNSEKGRLVGDVFSMCWLLTRQYNFLKQSLSNMNAWCKNDFSHEDYQATYAPPVKDKLKESRWKSSVVRIKIVCFGYKDPKGSPPLFGIIPPSILDVSAAKPSAMPVVVSSVASEVKAAVFSKAASEAFKTSSAVNGVNKLSQTAKAKKKREKLQDKAKSSSLGTTLATTPTLTAAAVAIATPPAPKTYAESSPHARRQKIMEKVAQLALELERSQAEASDNATIGKLCVIPEEETPLHTARMWEWLQSAGFYKQPTSRRLALKSPAIHPRGLFLPVATKIQGHEESNEQVSSNSLFDRLQSLLVEEIDEDEVERVDDNSDDSEDGNDSLGFLDEDDDDDIEQQDSGITLHADGANNANIADLSGLTIEERAFVHLSSVGLIRKSLFPKVELAASNGEKGNENGGEDDLVNIIGQMASDLSKITSTNNARISYLEIAAADLDLHHSKQIDEDQAALMAKCQSLLKRNKEKAKKAKQKKDDNLNLPW